MAEEQPDIGEPEGEGSTPRWWELVLAVLLVVGLLVVGGLLVAGWIVWTLGLGVRRAVTPATGRPARGAVDHH
jgi:hypothetical protein